MRVCVIHGSSRKGNTDRTIQIIKDELNTFEEILYSDVYLPRDLPHFCTGCFACLSTSEYAGENCPHKQYTHPILENLLESDGILIASPCYALAETAQIKAFFDHFACTFITHRPNEEMFNKIGMAVSTAAGAGTGRVVSTISRNLLFWGVKRTVKCKISMFAGDWDDMPENKRLKSEKLLRGKAKRFYSLMKNRYRLRQSLVSKGLWFMFKRLISSYPDTQPDKIFWKAKGWLR